MNRMIFAAIALFAACITVLGQVQLTNLDQKSFTVDISAPVTNIVNLHLRSNQFGPSTTGWVLTNISGVFGGSTNITTNSIWGIDGFGNITPIVTNNAVIATNIVRYGVGRMFGTESWLSKALTLTNGPNYIGAAENSQFFLIGPTTNPADCQIILSNAVATGQKLVLVNQTNAIPAEGAWTLTNNTPIPDGAGVVKLLGGYDLLSTNGYISYFEFISPDWQEVGRILASGASGLLTNVFNNIVVYSNITLKGNASLTINNVTLTTNDIWHTNIVAGVTNLQPVNLNLPVVISNTLSFQGNSGTNFLSASGNNLTWKSLSSTPQIVLNDGSTSTTYAPAGITDAGTSGAFQLYVNGSGGGATAIQLQGVGATHFLTPVTADVQLGYSGTSFLWEGSAISTRNRPSQWWGYSSGTGSADFELSHTGTNGVVLLNSVASNDAGVPRDFSFASNGVQIARVNMNSGYTGTGTNVFLDNGTFGAVPGGGGGGTQVFTNVSGTITPLGTGQVTNIFAFSSGLNAVTNPIFTLLTPSTDLSVFDQNPIATISNPSGDMLRFGYDGSIFSGFDAYSAYGGIGINHLVIEHNKAKGEKQQIGFVFETIENSSYKEYAGVYGDSILNGANTLGQMFLTIQLTNQIGWTNRQWLWTASAQDNRQIASSAGSVWALAQDNSYILFMAPTASALQPLSDPGANYLFGTFHPMTNDILQVSNATTNLLRVTPDGITVAKAGFSSTATDSAVSITTTGITNNLGKLAFAYLQGTNLVFTIKDSSNTPYFTNSVAIGIQTLPVQAGGAITISSGTASGVLKVL